MAKAAGKPKWIWIARQAHGEDCYLRARRTFTLASKPAAARLRITAFGEYVLYVNGRLVGRGPSPSIFDRPLLDVYNLDDLPLARGRNVIAVLAHSSYLSLPRRPRASGGLWVDLEVTGPRGSRERIVSDRQWRIAMADDFSPRAPRIHWSAGFTEVRDLRREPQGWTAARFRDTRWPLADEVAPSGPEGAPSPRPEERPLPRLTQTEVLPVAVVGTGRTTWPAGTTAIPFEFTMPSAAHGEFYAATFVRSEGRRRARLVFDCDEASAVYVNNRQSLRQGSREEFIDRLDAGEQNEYIGIHRGQGQRVDAAAVDLHEGWNSIGVVIYDPGSAWGFALRFEEPRTGRPMDLEFSPDQRPRHMVDWQIVLEQLCPCGDGWLPETPAPDARTFPDQAYQLAWESAEASDRAAAGAATLLAGEGTQGDATEKAAGRLVLKDREFVVYDLGREVVGTVEIDVDAAPGAILDVAWAETAPADSAGLDAVRAGVRQADRLILAARTETVCFFNRRACRYLELVARTDGDPVTIRRLAVRSTGCGSEPMPVPETADRPLAAALGLCAATIRACVQDTFEGSPAREAEQSIPAAMFLSQAQRVLEGRADMGEIALRAFAAEQDGDGFFRAIVPAGTVHVIPDWNLLWVIWLADHVSWTGDRRLAKDLYPVAARTLDWAASFRDSTGLLENKPDRLPWSLFVDLSPSDRRGVVTAWQALYARALAAAADVADLAGDDDAASHDRAEAKAVAKAARNHLWDADRGLFVDARLYERLSVTATVASNYYALYGGLANDEQAGRILSAFWKKDDTETADWGPAQNPFVKYFALESLLERGHAGRALAMIRSYWGGMARKGLATVPEVYPQGGPLPTAACHAWGVHPAALVAKWVLGVRPAGPGFEPILLAPMPGDIRKISGRVWTPKGPVEVSIGPNDRGRHISITVPGDATYRLDRSRLEDADEVEVTGGKAVK
jgi:alpha-L-rhamnosidase